MGGRLTEWVENVKELIAGINANYSKFFEKLDCAGEVSLHTPTDPVSSEIVLPYSIECSPSRL